MTSDSNNKPFKNYAYVDSQNLNMTIQNLGWSVDWAKFREYLAVKHDVAVAYLFIGYIAENQELYSFLQKAGFVIIFKPVVTSKDGTVKGNIDAELVLQVMIDQQQYDKAVVVTGDGDFHGLINHLYAQGKLEALLVPNMRQYSQLLKAAARDKIDFISNMRRELEYKKRSQRSYAPAAPIVEAIPAVGIDATTPATPASPSPAASNNNSSVGGGRRRGAQSQLEDALIKTLDNDQKPLSTNGPTDLPKAKPAEKPSDAKSDSK